MKQTLTRFICLAAVLFVLVHPAEALLLLGLVLVFGRREK